MRLITKIGWGAFAVCTATGASSAPAVTHAISHHASPPAVTSKINSDAAKPPAASGAAAPSGNQGLAQSIAASSHDWTSGNGQWSCLYQLWQRESGFQNTIANKSSKAWGIAQALGHGDGAAMVPVVHYPDGTEDHDVQVNEYGGFGLSGHEAKAANGGNAEYQIKWGLNYIQATYGNPCGAWSHETSAGWY